MAQSADLQRPSGFANRNANIRLGILLIYTLLDKCRLPYPKASYARTPLHAFMYLYSWYLPIERPGHFTQVYRGGTTTPLPAFLARAVSRVFLLLPRRPGAVKADALDESRRWDG